MAEITQKALWPLDIHVCCYHKEPSKSGMQMYILHKQVVTTEWLSWLEAT